MDSELLALHDYAILGNYLFVQSLVDKGVNFNGKNADGLTPLMSAVRGINDYKDVFIFLMNLDADIHCSDNDGWTVLHHASFMGRVEIVHCLVNKGVAIDVKNAKQGETPLMLAIQSEKLMNTESHREVIELLINSGADIHCCDNIGLTTLHHASVYGSVEVVQYLMNFKGIAFDAKDSYGYTPLMCAVLFSRIEVYQLLLNSGADIHCCDNNGRTALHHASCGGSVEIVQSLVNRGAAVNKKSHKGDTPFMLAAGRSSREFVELLINSDADIHCRDDYGWTALHHALEVRDIRDQRDIVQLLLKKGLDINAQNSRGSTPLHLAVYFDRIEIADYLLKAGADCNLENNKGESPFNILIRKNMHVETLKLCIEKGAYVKSTDYNKLLEDSLLKKVVLQDIKLCSRAVINKFDNADLPLLYKGLIPSQKLPYIDKMKVGNRKGSALEVEKAVAHEINTKGFCNLVDMIPLVLSILCVKSFIEKS